MRGTEFKPEGVAATRSVEPRAAPGADAARGGRVAGCELCAGEAFAATAPAGRGGRSAARQCRQTLEPGQAGGVAQAGIGVGAAGVRRGQPGGPRADAGGGASGERARDRSGGEHAAQVDVGGRVVETPAAAQAAPAAARPQGALWRVAAVGRQPSRVARRAGAAGVFDELGG